MHSIRFDHDVPMQTRDGVTLRADVCRPDDDERHPVILARTPYSKQRPGESDFLSPVAAARAGYAFVVQDTRGRFRSDGAYRPSMPEGDDSYDAVEWAAQQPWSDGSVGMFGLSYGARIQWQAALTRPPSLKAIAPGIGSAGNLSDFRRQGVLDFEQSVSWFSLMAPDMANRLERGGRDVTDIRKWLSRAIANPDEVLHHLPFKSVPHFDFDGIREGFLAVSSDKLPASVSSEADLLWDFSRVEVPCLHAGGWFDIFAGSTVEAYQGMRARGGTSRAREGQHMIMGPWVHSRQLPPNAGALMFGPTAGGPGSLIEAQHLAFFDRYLRGEDVEVPAVRYFVIGLNRWRNADQWPPAEAEVRRRYLHSRGNAQTASGDGTLGWEAPANEPADRYRYDPSDPVPSAGGRSLPTGSLAPGPVDQGAVEHRSDVLCFTSEALDQELEVTGPVALVLHATTSAPDTDFVAKLVDVHPNGRAYNLLEGVVRARYRDGLLAPQPAKPGEVMELQIDLASISVVFRKGHRLRLQLASSNFPRIDRNMNTGNPFGEDSAGVVAEQTVLHDAQHPSHLMLAVMPTG